MKHRSLLLLAAVTFASPVWSQPAQRLPVSNSDMEFAELRVLALPINPRPVAAGAVKTREEFEEDRRRQSVGFLRASEKAREFYTKNPTHPKAMEAKKIEAVSTLRAVQTGSIEQEARAIRLGREFRADMKNASRDRYEVAATMNQIDVSKKNIRERSALMAEYERRAFDLYGEFPDEPQLFEMLLGVARNSDPEKARAIVQRLHSMPAPAATKAEAQLIVDRLDMPGKALDLEWQDESGESHRISDYKGKAVVFHVWVSATEANAAARPASLPALGRSDVEVISVNLDRDVEKGKAAKRDGVASKSSYFDARGLNGPLAQQLKIGRVPAVHVVDANGIYLGSGAPAELESILAKAQR